MPMVQRILVRVGGNDNNKVEASGTLSKFQRVSLSCAFVVFAVAAAPKNIEALLNRLPASVVHRSLWFEGDLLWIFACLLICIIGYPLFRTSSRPSPGCSIALYPNGIQVDDVWFGDNNEIIRSKSLRFVPRESILDCVVLEVILTQRVRNALVLRLCSQSDGDQAVLDLLPKADLDYDQCMRLRHALKNYLDHLQTN